MLRMTAGVLLVSLVMNGCGDSTPSCSEDVVKELVLEITTDEFTKQIGSVQTNKVLKDVQLIAIRTNSADTTAKKTECAAQLKFINGNTSDITYDAQYTDSGDEVYVTVYGL